MVSLHKEQRPSSESEYHIHEGEPNDFLCEPLVHKKDGRILQVASLYSMARSVSDGVIVLDVRDLNEVDDDTKLSSKTAISLPINIDQQKQSVRPTTFEEFVAKFESLHRTIPYETPMITHCSSGGRGALAAEYLRQMGFRNVMNGGDPQRVRFAVQENAENILSACATCNGGC